MINTTEKLIDYINNNFIDIDLTRDTASTDRIILTTKGNKTTIELELRDHRKIKESDYLAEQYHGKICLSFNWWNPKCLQGGGFMDSIDEDTENKVKEFILQHLHAKANGHSYIQLSLFDI